MTVMVPRNKMIAVASKKIRCLSDKKLDDNLSYFCGSMAEASRVGVEEAQAEILSRLQELPTNIESKERVRRPSLPSEAAEQQSLTVVARGEN
jgi:hypothetical protein